MIGGLQCVQGLPTLCTLQGARDQLVRYSSHTKGMGGVLGSKEKGFSAFEVVNTEVV